MESQKDVPTHITRQDINNFPFQYKLWVIINSETCDCSKWNLDGTELELNIVALDDYLSSQQSIFKIKSLSAFIGHLRDFGFYVPISDPSQTGEVPKEASKRALQANSCELVMRFKHEHFLRHRIDLLAKIRRMNDTVSLEETGTEKKAACLPERMESDPCFASYGAMSKIQETRIKYQTILSFQSETKILKEKLRASETRSKSKALEEDADALIELPANMFENPHDSVLYMGDEHRTAYAGFYGNCSNDQIAKFFGDYLPMYENVVDDEMERRVLDLNPLGKVSSNVSLSAETSAQVVDDLSECPSTSPPLASLSLPPIFSVHYDEQVSSSPPEASSSLQPIFIGADDEEDISMDEFIKFKEQASDTSPMQTEEKFKVKQEVIKNEEDNENDANFKNFFRQYRESLSLLYEKQ